MTVRTPQDALSDLVVNMKLVAATYYKADLRGKFGLEMSSTDPNARFHMCLDGELSIWLPGSGETSTIRKGDVFLVLGGRMHVLCDAPSTPAVDIYEAKRRSAYREGSTFRWGTGSSGATLVCGEFRFRDEFFHPLLRTLPPLVRGSTCEGRDSNLRGLLALIDDEMSWSRAGSRAAVNRLSEVVLVHVLRAWFDDNQITEGGLRALADPRISRALAAMHGAPDRAWTVEELAKRAGMSRTAFSTSFHELLEVSPMAYLRGWRINIARALLQGEGSTISSVANDVGYRYQASFTKVFREIVGMTPAAFRAKSREGRLGENGASHAT